MTFPTKSHYVDQTSVKAPFSAVWSTGGACEQADDIFFDRESRAAGTTSSFPEPPPPTRALPCWTTNVSGLARHWYGRAIFETSVPTGSCLDSNGACHPNAHTQSAYFLHGVQ